MTQNPELYHSISRIVGDLALSQAEDGYLGPFPKSQRLLGNWDLWGHYHVIEALLLSSEQESGLFSFEIARKAANLICNTFLDTGRRTIDAGSPEMNLAVIHGLGMLYRKTGNERYLRMMREIEKD